MKTLLIAAALAVLTACGGGGDPGASLSHFCVISEGTPIGFCPTATPTPTPDSGLHRGCPVTPGEIEIIEGTPYVILARACTPTQTPTSAAWIPASATLVCLIVNG